ncbi:MAG: TIM-barrel domain-containing protein [Rhodanobacteraceae bacterium]
MAKLRMRALMALLLAGFAMAGNASVMPEVRSVGAQGFELTLGKEVISLQLIAPGVLRVHELPRGRATPASLVIDPQLNAGTGFKPDVKQDAATITLRSDRMVATWNKRTGALSVTDAHGHPLLQQADLAALARGRIELTHAKSDALYGISGFEANKSVAAGLLRSGAQVAKAGKQGWAGAPLVWSTAGYGVLVDCDGAKFDLADGQITISGYARQDSDYYLLAGTPEQLFADVSRISGHASLFPKWSLGFINSQWGLDEAEFKKIVATYRTRHIPLDAFTFDFDWKDWGKDWGEFRWNPQKFPDGPTGKLKAEMDRLGVHMTGIMKPRVHLDTIEGRYATAHDLWLPGEKATPDYFSHKPVKDLDFDKPGTRTWFFNDALKHSFEAGIVGWWNDEADTTDSNTQFLNMERAIYDGQRAISPLRVWSINRDFWLGAQRYAYGMWSGDIDTGFASMADQRARMLSAINVGEMQWGMDGGGFNGHPSDENYARWIEFGAFTPIFRVHGTFGEKRQPWVYGPVAEAAATRAIRLRYSLLPYMYAYQHQDQAQGIGLVRPLAFEWPRDPNVRNDVDAWLFGEWLLVSPVVEQGQTIKQIYLPAGTWTDWFTGKVYAGGQTIAYPVDAKRWDDIPLFIRDGAIIPTQQVMDYVGEHPVTTVTIEVFPSAQVTYFDYYDDDGTTYDYAKGAYDLQSLSVRKQGNAVDFQLGAPAGTYKPALRHYLLAIHGGASKGVRVNGKPLAASPSLDVLKQTGAPGWAGGHDRYGAVTWVKLDAGHAADVRIGTKSP